MKTALLTATCLGLLALMTGSAQAGLLFPPNNIGSNPNVSCPNGQVLAWHGDRVDCADPTPGVSVSCPAGQVLKGINNGVPACLPIPSVSLFVAFDGMPSSPAIKASSGIASVTRFDPWQAEYGTMRAGNYKVTFATTMTSTNYIVSGSSQAQANGANTWICDVEKHLDYVFIQTCGVPNGVLTAYDSPDVAIVIQPMP